MSSLPSDPLTCREQALAGHISRHAPERIVRLADRALASRPEDAPCHYVMACALDRLGLEPDRVGDHFQRAFAFRSVPFSATWWRRRIHFVLTCTHYDRAEFFWSVAQSRMAWTRDLYFDLHVPVAAMAICRNQFELAELVLEDVPDPVQEMEVFRELARDLIGQRLAEYEPHKVVGPRTYHPDEWLDGPHLLETTSRLERWATARIQDRSDDVMHLNMAYFEPADADEPVYATMDLPRDDFNDWTNATITWSDFPGQFLEIGAYTDHETPVIRVHERTSVQRSYQPIDPPPNRYLVGPDHSLDDFTFESLSS